MCTVTFIPDDQRSGFILTSNRDESPGRGQALSPSPYRINGTDVYYPKDPVAGGTWIATSEDLYTACLLNGAFERHTWNPPYAKSRGLVLLDFFRIKDPLRFAREYDFDGIEPFTILLLNSNKKLQFDELRWDGNQIHHKALDPQKPAIRSSATLYDPEVIHNKELLFQNWMNDHLNPDPDDVLHFHYTAGTGDPFNNFVMNRNNKVRTVSITQIVHMPGKSKMVHRDLNEEEIIQVEIC